MTVIGGALLTGGYGSVVGSLLGALIFGMLQTGLVLVGIESRLFSGTIGVIIIAAVVLNYLGTRRAAELAARLQRDGPAAARHCGASMAALARKVYRVRKRYSWNTSRKMKTPWWI